MLFKTVEITFFRRSVKYGKHIYDRNLLQLLVQFFAVFVSYNLDESSHSNILFLNPEKIYSIELEIQSIKKKKKK